MTWQVVGASAYDNSGSTWGTTNFAWPSPASGDLAIVVVSWYENGQDTAWAAPTGTGSPSWTQRVSAVVLDGTSSAESKVDIYTAVCAGTEDTNTLTVARSEAGHVVYGTAIFAVLRGASALSFTAIDTGTKVTAATEVVANGITASANDGMLVAVCDSGAGNHGHTAAQMTVVQGSLNNGSNTCSLWYEDLSSTGATGSRTFQFAIPESPGIAQAWSLQIAGVGFSGASTPTMTLDIAHV